MLTTNLGILKIPIWAKANTSVFLPSLLWSDHILKTNIIIENDRNKFTNVRLKDSRAFQMLSTFRLAFIYSTNSY